MSHCTENEILIFDFQTCHVSHVDEFFSLALAMMQQVC